MLRSKLTKIQDPWPRAQNAAQKRVPSPNPGSDDIHTEDRDGEGETVMKYSGRKINLQM